MKQFNVYLNKRLTEAEIIIKSMASRDGLFIRTRMYLQSAVNTLLLTRYMDYTENAILTAKADELLKEAHETFGTTNFMNTQELTLLAGIERQFSNEMRLLTLDVLVTSTLLEIFTSRANLSSAISEFEVSKVLGDAGFDAILSSDMVYDVQKEVREWMDTTALLGAKTTLSKQGFNETSFGATMSTAPFGIFWFSDFGDCSSTLVLSSESADYILQFVFSGENELILSASSGDDWTVTKSFDISTSSELLFAVSAILDKIINTDDSSYILYSAVSALLGRYRLCSDIDSAYVSDIDNMKMSELDYVIITE